MQSKLEPTKQTATLLYAGIISNTQNFTGIVTDRDRDMAAWLKNLANLDDTFAERMLRGKSDLTGDKLKKALHEDHKLITIGDLKLATSQLEIFDAERLLSDRRPEIESILRDLFKPLNTPYQILVIKHLDDTYASFLCLNEESKQLIENLPNITWQNNRAISRDIVMRKHLAKWIATNQK